MSRMKSTLSLLVLVALWNPSVVLAHRCPSAGARGRHGTQRDDMEQIMPNCELEFPCDLKDDKHPVCGLDRKNKTRATFSNQGCFDYTFCKENQLEDRWILCHKGACKEGETVECDLWWPDLPPQIPKLPPSMPPPPKPMVEPKEPEPEEDDWWWWWWKHAESGKRSSKRRAEVDEGNKEIHWRCDAKYHCDLMSNDEPTDETACYADSSLPEEDQECSMRNFR